MWELKLHFCTHPPEDKKEEKKQKKRKKKNGVHIFPVRVAYDKTKNQVDTISMGGMYVKTFKNVGQITYTYCCRFTYFVLIDNNLPFLNVVQGPVCYRSNPGNMYCTAYVGHADDTAPTQQHEVHRIHQQSTYLP